MSSAVKSTNAKKGTAKPSDASNVKASKSPKAQAAASASADSGANTDAPHAVIIGPVMRKKELVDAVVERSGVKKKDAKPVVEAMLEVLGEALADSRELNLLPMGKFKVVNEKDLGNGKMMRVKVRQVTPTDKDAAADTDETDI